MSCVPFCLVQLIYGLCAMCKLLQISQVRTSVYHPQMDGLVEWFNTEGDAAEDDRGGRNELGLATTLPPLRHQRATTKLHGVCTV